LAEQPAQACWGGWQLHEPSVLQTPLELVHSLLELQVVVWHSPPTQRPLTQSVLTLQARQSPTGGVHWHEPSALHVPP
jgi:hypothetical protein